MTQLSLCFDPPRQTGSLTGPAPSRRNATRSSVEAAERHDRSGRTQTHAEVVYAAVRECSGSTAAELCAIYGLFDVVEWRRRLTGLKDAGRIEQGEQRQCRVAGTLAVTWIGHNLAATDAAKKGE